MAHSFNLERKVKNPPINHEFIGKCAYCGIDSRKTHLPFIPIQFKPVLINGKKQYIYDKNGEHVCRRCYYNELNGNILTGHR